jgi:lysophospholipase L1-like esterase
MNQPSDPDTTPQRLDSLAGALVAALPDAIIIIARIVPAAAGSTASWIRVYNNTIKRLMAARTRNGEYIIMVDMPSGVQTSVLGDGLHPNDRGYKNMPIMWVISITAADC